MASIPQVRIVARDQAALRWHEGPSPAISESDRRAVDDLWHRALGASKGTLHDSPLLIYRDHETANGITTVHGVYLPYRYYYARCHDDGLSYDIKPIGVSGVCILQEGDTRAVVIGRRSASVTQYPNLWECVPSGGVDDTSAWPDGTVDFAAALLHEFEEEACLPASCVRAVTPFAVIFDTLARTYDICCEMPLDIDRGALVDAMGRSREYSEVVVVGERELNPFLARTGDRLIPLSRAILQLFGKRGTP